MAIIGNVEKRNWKSRILNLLIHLILLLGAITMVYPLLLMLSGSIKSSVDFDDFSLLPEYVFNDELLYKKHLFTKFNGETLWIFNYFRMPPGALINLPVPQNPSRKQYEDFKEFLHAMRNNMPHCWRMIGMASEGGVVPLVQRQYTEWLVQKFGPGHSGLTALNNAYKTDFSVWDEVHLPKENFFPRRADTDYTSPMLKDVLEFKNTQISELHTIWFDFDSQYISDLRRKFANDLNALNKKFGTKYNSWKDISLPSRCPENPEFAAYWLHEVHANINPNFIKIDPAAKIHWTVFLRKRYQGNPEMLNHLYKKNIKFFAEIPLPTHEPEPGQLRTDWNFFLFSAVPKKYIQVETFAEHYHRWLQKRYTNLMELNDLYCIGYKSFSGVDFPESYPYDNLRKAADWTNFIKKLNAEETGLARFAMAEFREFIFAKCRYDFKQVSLLFRQEIVSKNEIPFYTKFPDSTEIGSQVKDFYREYVMQPKHLSQRVISDTVRLRPEWIKFLKKQYPDIDALNKSWGLIYSSWDQVAPPFAEYEWFNLRQNRIPIIKEYLKRNYLMVFDTIQTNGFAAKNTLIYCLFAVLASLIVNPLCAYALSRFQMAPAYKILLFLMLPMAFPVMVLGIPQFLLIKKMGLLNTFAALILPSMANGYMIFLLKGFFDSLPRELFESAALDGASEWTVFWHIAMSLSTPILSVLALNTFTAAYGNFMMAFLLCQDKSMWTMMVYLYQLQQTASPAVGFAALVVAAIPTLLVFIFCQNIIIKGIVVPSEK